MPQQSHQHSFSGFYGSCNFLITWQQAESAVYLTKLSDSSVVCAVDHPACLEMLTVQIDSFRLEHLGVGLSFFPQ
jgi:hypothetical protein